MFIDTLNNILNELSEHKNKRDLSDFVNERLNKSLDTYYKELTNAVKFLTKKENIRMLRKINKE